LIAILSLTEPRVLIVAMEGIENILKCGQKYFINQEG